MAEVIQIVKELKRKVSDKFGKAEVILFGSKIKASAKEESDIDVLVILNRNVDLKVKETIYDIAYELSLRYDEVLDVSVYSKEEWERYKASLPFIINVEKEGTVI